MNLCLNARDAMSHGGKLTVSTANVTLDGAFCELHPQARPGSFVRLCVADTGVGIPPEILDKVFEPFFTTKPLGEGTGLGLAVVYGAVSQAGGWILVSSEPGQGSRFEAYLPRADGIADCGSPAAE